MEQALAAQAALELREAYASGPIEPIAPRLVPNTVEAGYAVQDVNTRFWIDAGRRVVGAKIGLTSAAVRKQIGVEQPDFGILFADMEIPDDGEHPVAGLSQPRAEAEIAFKIGASLEGDSITRADVVAATEWIAPAIEVVASRIEGWRCAIADTVADNASAGMFVVGRRRTPLEGIDLASLGMTLKADGVVVSEGLGAASMGDPVEAVVWLARTLADFGRPLGPGDIVLSGALGPLVWVEPGTSYAVEIEGLGTASVRFTG